MTAYDRWLEKPYQDACDRQDAIDEIIEELLDDELDWRNPSVFLEAINEGACLDSKDIHTRLKEILAQGHSYADIGELVYDAVLEYCNTTAEARARRIIQIRKK